MSEYEINENQNDEESLFSGALGDTSFNIENEGESVKKCESDLEESCETVLESIDENSLDLNKIFILPEPGSYAIHEDICFITDSIPMQLLYSAYLQGVFPWFSEDDGEPVIWYSPDPRFCLLTENFHIPKSLDKFLKKSPYTYTMDKAFRKVMLGCRNMKRSDQDGTWIGKKMLKAYCRFHKLGFAHSIEVWHEGVLAGGLYGILIGSVFFGESMFTKESDSAKSAFALFARTFSECGGKLIDSQVYTDNIARFGAKDISRKEFLGYEKEWLFKPLEKNIKIAFRKKVEQFYKEENLPKGRK